MFPTKAWVQRLKRSLQRRGRSPEDSEDLIQEAFLRLQEYLRVAEVRDPQAFLARTVANLAINQYRRGRILCFSKETLDDLEQTAALADPGPGPERILVAQQRLDEIQRVLGAVSEQTCRIFLAQRLGYSYEEIASELQISQRTVQKHIARAVFLLMNQSAPP
jgi:RNA polymerase sigma factor (sigma-70 family)